MLKIEELYKANLVEKKKTSVTNSHKNDLISNFEVSREHTKLFQVMISN